jgi:hypothetical protein
VGNSRIRFAPTATRLGALSLDMRRLAILVVVAGCGGIDLADFDAERRNAFCAYLTRCKAVATIDDCRAHYERRAVYSPNIPAAVTAGKLRYDEAAAEDCIAAFHALSCDTTRQTEDSLAACDVVFTGTLKEGEACGFDLECTSDRCVKPTCELACCIGSCGPDRPVPRIGEPCTFTCEPGAYCGSGDTCRALLPEGAVCNDPSSCALGLYCANSGVCTAIPHLGEACELSICAEVNATCSRGVCVEMRLPGESCVDAGCSGFYECASDNVCRDYPTLGMPCATRCAGNSWCDISPGAGGECALQKRDGSSCVYNDECESHYCRSNTCATPALCI